VKSGASHRLPQCGAAGDLPKFLLATASQILLLADFSTHKGASHQQQAAEGPPLRLCLAVCPSCQLPQACVLSTGCFAATASLESPRLIAYSSGNEEGVNLETSAAWPSQHRQLLRQQQMSCSRPGPVAMLAETAVVNDCNCDCLELLLRGTPQRDWRCHQVSHPSILAIRRTPREHQRQAPLAAAKVCLL